MQQKYLEQTRQELKLRNYSFKTIKAYLGCLREYFDFKKPFDLLAKLPAEGGMSTRARRLIQYGGILLK